MPQKFSSPFQEQLGGLLLTLPNFQTFHKAAVIKTVWPWQQDKYRDQEDGVEWNSEFRNAHIYAVIRNISQVVVQDKIQVQGRLTAIFIGICGYAPKASMRE